MTIAGSTFPFFFCKKKETKINLAGIRDLLLPGLYSHRMREQHSYLDLRIEIHYETESLLVKGSNPKNGRELGFCITKEAIIDERYISEFMPSVRQLISLLTRDMTPEEEKKCHP